MVERFNATFVPQVAKLQDRENNNWDEFLSPVVFVYNSGGKRQLVERQLVVVNWSLRQLVAYLSLTKRKIIVFFAT